MPTFPLQVHNFTTYNDQHSTLIAYTCS